MTSEGRGLDAAMDKGHVEQKEDIENGGRGRQSSMKHGDRALAIIGDDRVSLTDEDVGITLLISTPSIVNAIDLLFIVT